MHFRLLARLGGCGGFGLGLFWHAGVVDATSCRFGHVCGMEWMEMKYNVDKYAVSMTLGENCLAGVETLQDKCDSFSPHYQTMLLVRKYDVSIYAS